MSSKLSFIHFLSSVDKFISFAFTITSSLVLKIRQASSQPGEQIIGVYSIPLRFIVSLVTTSIISLSTASDNKL